MLDHYLELLARKPGALGAFAAAGPGTRPWELAGDASMSCGSALRARWGESEADRQMVDVLMLCREHGPATRRARRPRRARGRRDRRTRGRGARPTHRARPRRRPGSTGSKPGSQAHDRPEPDLAGYDQLIGGGR